MNNVEFIRSYMGGDEYDIPISETAVEHLQYLIDNCKRYKLPAPDVFPWYGGDGVQAEWEYKDDWYIEIGSSSERITGYFSKGKENKEEIQCSFENIKDAFLLVKVFLESVVKK